MATVLAPVRRSALTANYDPIVDVLHVVRGAAVPAEGDGSVDGLELTYSLHDGTPCGATVIGFRRNGWQERTDELVAMVAIHVGSSSHELTPVIRSALATSGPPK